MRPVRSIRALLAAALALALTGVVATTSSAGTADDYPEFPYPATRYAEDNRGQFHFSSRGGWLNDPNGTVYYRGTYHLFYQHNPHGLEWDTMHWGHATSTDLVHWQQQPIALEPGVHPGTLFSGGAVVDAKNVTGLKDGDDDPIIAFSNTDGVSVYYSTDGARTFKAWKGGEKVITTPGESRDPQVHWDEAAKAWVMVLWSNENGNGANFYRSTNLVDWTRTSRYQADWLFECPQLQPMKLDGRTSKWVLSDGSGEYVVGTFANGAFTADDPAPKRINSAEGGAGGHWYAALNVQNMPDDRVVQIAWMGRNRGSVWTGNMSVPVEQRLVSTPEGPTVYSTPVRELSSIVSRTTTVKPQKVKPQDLATLLDDVSLDLADIDLVLDARQTSASKVTLRLHTGPNGWADRDLVWDKAAQTLDGVPLKTRPDGTVAIRALVDRGQLEVYGNDGAYYRSLDVNFDSLPGGDGVQLVADGRVAVKKLEVRRLASTWNVGESTLRTNIPGPWYPASGTWTDVTGGKQGASSGDAFYLSTAIGSDVTYEGDVKVVEGTAAALTLRSDREATRHYTVNIDVDAGVVKLWRPGRDIASYRTPLERGRFYHLKVRAEGDRFQVWFDGSAEPVIDARDATTASGQFGLNMFRGRAVMQDVTTTPLG